MLIVAIVLHIIWRDSSSKKIKFNHLSSCHFQTCMHYFLLRNMKDDIILVTKQFPLPMTFYLYNGIYSFVQSMGIETIWLATFFKISYSAEECQSYRSGVMWGCVNDRSFLFEWIIPLSVLHRDVLCNINTAQNKESEVHTVFEELLKWGAHFLLSTAWGFIRLLQ